MKFNRPLTRWMLGLVLIAVLAPACSDESDSTETTGNNASANNTSGNNAAANNAAANNAAGNNTSANNAAGNNAAANNAAANNAAGNNTSANNTTGNNTSANNSLPGPVESCGELGDDQATECFSNDECQADRLCANVGTSDMPVACCVVGTRGTKQAGEECNEATGDRECASGLCISRDIVARCSKPCASNEECPVGMNCSAAMGLCVPQE